MAPHHAICRVRRPVPRAARRAVCGRPVHARPVGLWAEFAGLSGALDEAAALLAADPDAAAMVLDGALARLARAWYAAAGIAMPEPARLLNDLERRAAPFAWRLRLALRAPDARARLVHARHLLAVLAGLPATTTHPSTTRGAHPGAPASPTLALPPRSRDT